MYVAVGVHVPACSFLLAVNKCVSSHVFRQQLCLPAEEIDGNLFVRWQID